MPEARGRAAEGSGVGLAVVRELVLAHDGHVQVVSRLGAGSRFRVHLPLPSQEQIDVPSRPSPGPRLTAAAPRLGTGAVEAPVHTQPS
jgi:hypothetical protein